MESLKNKPVGELLSHEAYASLHAGVKKRYGDTEQLFQCNELHLTEELQLWGIGGILASIFIKAMRNDSRSSLYCGGATHGEKDNCGRPIVNKWVIGLCLERTFSMKQELSMQSCSIGGIISDGSGYGAYGNCIFLSRYEKDYYLFLSNAHTMIYKKTVLETKFTNYDDTIEFSVCWTDKLKLKNDNNENNDNNEDDDDNDDVRAESGDSFESVIKNIINKSQYCNNAFLYRIDCNSKVEKGRELERECAIISDLCVLVIHRDCLKDKKVTAALDELDVNIQKVMGSSNDTSNDTSNENEETIKDKADSKHNDNDNDSTTTTYTMKKENDNDDNVGGNVGGIVGIGKRNKKMQRELIMQYKDWVIVTYQRLNTMYGYEIETKSSVFYGVCQVLSAPSQSDKHDYYSIDVMCKPGLPGGGVFSLDGKLFAIARGAVVKRQKWGHLQVIGLNGETCKFIKNPFEKGIPIEMMKIVLHSKLGTGKDIYEKFLENTKKQYIFQKMLSGHDQCLPCDKIDDDLCTSPQSSPEPVDQTVGGEPW